MATKTVQDAIVNPAKTGKSTETNWAWQTTRIVNQHSTLANELRTDHATFKTAVDATNTWTTEVDADLDAINNYLDYIHEADGVYGGDYTFASTGAVTILGAGNLLWRRAGIRHYAALDTTITLAAPSTTTIGAAKFGAWRVLVSDLGVITTQAANATTMQFANAEDALLNCSAIAPTASTVTIGYLILENGSGGDFTIGTTNTNAASMSWTFYYERGPRKQVSGLTAALGSSVVADAAAATWSVGTIDHQALGIGYAQISAITNQAMDDADTIADGEAGGWLLVTNLAGTGVYALASDGIAGSVSALANTDAAGVATALDTLADRLPGQFVPIGKITVVNGSGSGFTAGTTNWDATGITTTVADASVGTWDRTSTTGFDSHRINPPAVPATVTAAIPAAGPATITAVAADDLKFRIQGTPS